jgi:hypothetical protein
MDGPPRAARLFFGGAGAHFRAGGIHLAVSLVVAGLTFVFAFEVRANDIPDAELAKAAGGILPSCSMRAPVTW